MTSQQINTQITALDKAIASKHTPPSLLPRLEAKKKELQALTKEVKNITVREKKIKNPVLKSALKTQKANVKKKSVAAQQSTKDLLATVQAKIADFNKGRNKSSLKNDARIKANKPGKHKSASGKTYYENRPDHTDISPKDRLASGGRIKSALMRDRKYTSQQEWEQRYERKGKKRTYAHYKAEGGPIDSEYYENNTGAELWDKWSKQQRGHFLTDHFKDEFEHTKKDEFELLCTTSFTKLPEEVQAAIEMHRRMGQYAKGGKVVPPSNKFTVFGYETKYFTPAAVSSFSKARELINNDGENHKAHADAIKHLAETVDDIFAIENKPGILTKADIETLTDNLMLCGLYAHKSGHHIKLDFLRTVMVNIFNTHNTN